MNALGRWQKWARTAGRYGVCLRAKSIILQASNSTKSSLNTQRAETFFGSPKPLYIKGLRFVFSGLFVFGQGRGLLPKLCPDLGAKCLGNRSLTSAISEWLTQLKLDVASLCPTMRVCERRRTYVDSTLLAKR